MTAALEGGEWVSSTPRPHFSPGKDPLPILQEAGWVPEPVWTGGISRPHRDSSPDRPARSQSLYRLSYRAHTYTVRYQCQNVEKFNIRSCHCARQNGVGRSEGILNLCNSGVSDLAHPPAALHKSNAPVVTEPVRTYWKRENPVTYVGNQTPIPRSSRRHTDDAIIAQAVK